MEPRSAAYFLTAEERERFAAWLEADAAADIAIAEQTAKLPDNIASVLVAERMADAKAKQRIAAQLRATEDVTMVDGPLGYPEAS